MSGALVCPPGSRVASFAEGLAWAWEIGFGRGDGPAIGFCAPDETAAMASGLETGELAGLIVCGDPVAGQAPAARRRTGIARFADGTRTEGTYTIFGEGEPACLSSLGAHAVRDGSTLRIGFEPDRDWGRFDSFWACETILGFLREAGVEARTALAGLGLMRLDDTPGTALHQVQEREKSDRFKSRQLKATRRRLRAAGAVLNLAVAAEALEGGERVPLDRVWPDSVAQIAAGVAEGVFEPICHGVLHLDWDLWQQGEIEYREFARLDAAEAGRRLDAAVDWQERKFGRPGTFVAPAWAYGPAGDAEAARRGLQRIHRPEPGPLYRDGRISETLASNLPGLHGIDYRPLSRLSACGIPPTLTMHGALIDDRMRLRRSAFGVWTLARLFFYRDMPRLIRRSDIRWAGISEFGETLRRHPGNGDLES